MYFNCEEVVSASVLSCYVIVTLPVDGRNYRLKHVVYIMNIVSYQIVPYIISLFSFSTSVQDYIIHMDMEIFIFVVIKW